MGIFKEPLIVLNPEIFPWICDFRLQWSTVSMNCSVGVSLSRGRSLPAFPNLWRNKWKSCLCGGFLSPLVSNEKKSYPAVSVRTTLPPFLCPFPTRMKKSAENHSWMLAWSRRVDWVEGRRNQERSGKQLGKIEKDLGTLGCVEQENRLHKGKRMKLQQEVSRMIWWGQDQAARAAEKRQLSERAMWEEMTDLQSSLQAVNKIFPRERARWPDLHGHICLAIPKQAEQQQDAFAPFFLTSWILRLISE